MSDLVVLVFGGAVVALAGAFLHVVEGLGARPQLAHGTVLAGELLGGGHDLVLARAWGTRFGHAMALQAHAGAPGQPAHVEVYAWLPSGGLIGLYVHAPRHVDTLYVVDGELRDIVVGVPPFDARFIVEGAPEPLVRALLDDRVQRMMWALPGASIRTVDGAGGHALVVAAQFLPQQRDELELLLREVAYLATRASRLIAETLDAPMVPAGGAPFRGGPPVDTTPQLRAAMAADVAALEARRRARREWGPR